jgi:hypothetical protein
MRTESFNALRVSTLDMTNVSDPADKLPKLTTGKPVLKYSTVKRTVDLVVRLALLKVNDSCPVAAVVSATVSTTPFLELRVTGLLETIV